jgi:hypothetical protein
MAENQLTEEQIAEFKEGASRAVLLRCASFKVVCTAAGPHRECNACLACPRVPAAFALFDKDGDGESRGLHGCLRVASFWAGWPRGVAAAPSTML